MVGSDTDIAMVSGSEWPHDDLADKVAPHPALRLPGPLLLVEHEAFARARLGRALAANGFAVTSVASAEAALTAAVETRFAYAVVGMQPGKGDSLVLVRRLRKLHASAWIVVVTDHDSFAGVVLAVRAGADDYFPKLVSESELVDALLGQSPALPPIPTTPLRVERVCWEHIQRLLEQCGRNRSEAARRLGMYRRSLQRMLTKRAPRPRGWPDTASGPG
jgi:two-component system, response regulator RegA